MSAPVLHAHELLSVWEQGLKQHPIDRALTILLYTDGRSRQELAQLSIGERDVLLLDVYAALFGDALEGVDHCPQCSTEVEFDLNISSIRSAAPAANQDCVQSIDTGQCTVRFRLPNSHDLAAIVGCQTQKQAQEVLLGRCLSVDGPGKEDHLDIERLSEREVQQIQKAMGALDPQAEITLNLRCPECGEAWEALFDIGLFLWQRIVARAQQLLLEVQILAKAYGWAERDVLDLSPIRRSYYLEALSL